MGRPTVDPTTALGAALRERRAAAPLVEAALDAGVPYTTLSRLERGTHRPSADSARRLARWLGWSVEQVLDAADQAPTAE